ncbi:hypothetical protein [Alteromonas mediterranea]|nr:hypothetical protein [Alteromonas mediterranea]
MLRIKVSEGTGLVTESKIKLIATLSQPFYAMMAETEEQDEIAVISRKTAQALNVSSGDTILLSNV